MKSFLLITFLVFAFCSIDAQRAGTLDKTFADSGLLEVSSGINGQPRASVVLKDDKFLVLNSTSTTTQLTRFLPNGKVDNSFGTDGNQKVLIYIYGPYSLAIQQDDKIVLASSTTIPPSHGVIVLLRYMPDGTPDSSFGKNGIYIDSTKAQINPYDMVQQPDGKLLLCGNYLDDFSGEGHPYPMLARYNANGTRDNSFGDTGKAIQLGSAFTPVSIALQKDGKIVCGGAEITPYSCILKRYKPNGSLDKSFGINGIVETNFTKYLDFYSDIAIQDDGRIVAVGTAQDNSGNLKLGPQMAAARYNSNGALDETFDQDGKTMIPFAIYTLGKSVALQPDGKIVISCLAANENADYGVGRLNADGSLDSSFGSNGKTLTPVGEGYDEPYQVALQSNGNIIVSGFAVEANNQYSTVLARYYGDPTKQQSPIVKKIKRWIRNHTLNWQCNADVDYFVIEQSTNGINDFKELAKVKAVNRQSLNVNDVYTYNLNDFANSQQLKANSKTYYRITAVSNNSKVVSTVISDEDVISITISPNPVKDVMKISGLPANQKTTINIVNRNGNIIHSAVCNSSVYNMNVSALHSGMYNVQVNVNGKLQSVKFVKE